MDSLVVYTTSGSSRLKYVLDWLFREQLRIDYAITHREDVVAGLPFFISYGKTLKGGLSIPDSGLLWQTGTQQVQPPVGAWNDLPTIFASSETGFSLPFDLFSAVFYLLSRYEEYYPHKADNHNRYPATASILYKNGWLQRPLADEWIFALGKLLQSKYGINIPPRHFTFQPTYDIDMAYSYLFKDMKRTIGAYARDMIKGRIRQVAERTKVLRGKQKDPYDSFRWLRQLHKQYDCRPVYFILSALKTTAFDKNISPVHPAMVRVIKNLVKEGDIGIHPSYYCQHADTFSSETKALGQAAGLHIHVSRQHYIRMKLPDTYRTLLKSGIKEDYSMGYGAHLGFRAATGNSFLWYDLQHEEITALRIHPFCFMDTTARFEAKLSLSEAFEKLNAMSKVLEKTGSVMITIFHNFSLGTDSSWKGWRQAYEHFVHEKVQANSAI
jgi:hypothetical protein